MKEISLKKIVKETGKEVPAQTPKESYPSFSIYENAPGELMKLDIGKELTAKIRMSSKETHEGSNTRKSCGFDVISVFIDDSDEKVEGARSKGKEIADRIRKEGVR